MRINLNVLWYLIFFALIILGMVVISLLMKLFFSLLLWAVGGEFIMTTQDIKQCIKIGICGGTIGGGGIILFKLLKIRGF